MPVIHMHAKVNHENKKLNVPGPGTYAPIVKDVQKAAPRYGFGTSKRDEKKNLITPGPGSYKLPNTISELPGYAMPNVKDENKFGRKIFCT